MIAAETVLSDVDGANGRLIIRGMPVEELARSATAESAAALLFDGFFEDMPDEQELAAAIGTARRAVFRRLRTASGGDRIAAAGRGACAPGMALIPDGDDLATALLLLAAPAVLTPAIIRSRRGEQPLAPDAGAGQAADMLRMLTGSRPTDAASRALNAYLATVCEHGLNASTFAAGSPLPPAPGWSRRRWPASAP